MKTLLITRELPQRVLEAAKSIAQVTIRADQSPMQMAEAKQALSDYDMILPTLGDQFNGDVFDRASRCRLLANFGVGYNHIDVGAAVAAGLQVSNTPGAVTDATADIALTLILMTARRAGEGERMVRAGTWDGWHPTQLLGMHLGGRTLGIIGMGRIGKAIAKRAHFGFGMDIAYYNRSKVADFGVPATQLGSIEAVLAAADIVVLAVPATPQTRHLMNADRFAQMQRHGLLINIARGDIIDEAALVAALQSGQIAGAGLDVYEREPIVSKELLQMENVTLLPHLGTAALNVREDMGLMAVDNIKAFLDGAPLPNGVTA
ncbi:D-glycerate dehydrogenase [Nereida sp. MMG025]|uniref:2-hydroxyacid dehydrogenase n=1 Tax=Nereida sp. MMG025 TaxID=2909981 RepID=UPI001F38FD66|nr:D-glycerate dehydrogenase [Nereida sp. MMG025]MCF6444074.1 D-glycerate dehydrogenase [Nereida sp. MMG025]